MQEAEGVKEMKAENIDLLVRGFDVFGIELTGKE